jgi:hypothetical protein
LRASIFPNSPHLLLCNSSRYAVYSWC